MLRTTQTRPTPSRRRRALNCAPRPHASSRPEHPQRESAVARGQAAATGRLILVVDDEPSVRIICSFNLKAAGLDVVEAVDGVEALRVVRDRRPDLVLLDVMMPNRDGWAVAADLAGDARTRDIPVVFLSARVDDADRQRAHHLGAVGYITKPFDPIVLATRLEQTLERLARGEREQLRDELLHTREA